MDAEIAMYLEVIEEAIDKIVGPCLDGIPTPALHFKPLPSANSLAIIARHAMADTRWKVIGSFAGDLYERRRPEEFVAGDETAESLRARWEALRRELHTRLDTIPASRLGELCEHPRLGPIPGRAMLLQAARHTYEHVGEAQLTHDLVASQSR